MDRAVTAGSIIKNTTNAVVRNMRGSTICRTRAALVVRGSWRNGSCHGKNRAIFFVFRHPKLISLCSVARRSSARTRDHYPRASEHR